MTWLGFLVCLHTAALTFCCCYHRAPGKEAVDPHVGPDLLAVGPLILKCWKLLFYKVNVSSAKLGMWLSLCLWSTNSASRQEENVCGGVSGESQAPPGGLGPSGARPGPWVRVGTAEGGSSSSHTPLVGEAQPRGQEVPGQSARRFQRRKAHATPGLLGPCVCNPVCSNCLPLRESFPRQVDKKSRGPQGERGLEFSKRKQDKLSFFLCIL